MKIKQVLHNRATFKHFCIMLFFVTSHISYADHQLNKEYILQTKASTITLDNNIDASRFTNLALLTNTNKKVIIKALFGGSLQYAAWLDTRQIVAFGDGFILLWPKKRVFDVDCNDINAQGQTNMISIETKIRCDFLGPEILGAKSSAYIESDLIGTDYTSLTGIGIDRWRLRHAFFQLDWPKTTLMLGQYWHPFLLPKNFPLVIANAGGVPAQGYAFCPQIRIIAKNDKGVEFALIASTQLGFESTGPLGLSTTYSRNSRMPELSCILSYESEHHYAGFGLNHLRLKPRLESNKGFRVDESINSIGLCAFNVFKYDPFELRTDLIFMQNGVRLGILGGYAVSSVDPTTDERTYTNISSINFWMDFNMTRPIEPGFFLGFSKTLGARQCIIPCIFNPKTNSPEQTLYGADDPLSSADGDQLDTVLKIVPRVRCHYLPFIFALECEISRAGFGCINNRGKIENIDPVVNFRTMFSTYYYF